MRKHFVIAITGAALFLLSDSAQAQKKYTLKKSQLVTVSSNQLCGLIKNKWTPVKKSGKKYLLDKKNKSRCKTLLAPNTFKKSGLASIPSASEMLKARSSTASLAVSGTPPLLKDIPALGAKDVFWASGFIDNLVATQTPTQGQCQEFFHGMSDGQSSGMLGCYSVQGVGYSFQSILDGSASACLMRGIPTKENLEGGAVTVVDGSIPDGDITKIFSPPSGTEDRVVKILIGAMGDGGPGGGGPGGGGGGQGGKTGFIRVFSSKKLQSAGLQYGVTLWFCQDGETTPNNYQETTVSLGGEYKFSGVHVSGTNEFQHQISAFLTKNGANLAFDLTKERSANTVGEFNGANFKSFVTIFPDNTIATKVKESFSGFGRSNYGVASFDGGRLSEFRVRSAAIKDAFANRSLQAGVEYREPIYVSAPDASLVSKLQDVDIATDAFYAEAGTVTPDFSGKSCTAEADITLAMNFSNPLLIGVFMSCANDRLSNMEFCRSGEIFQAQSKCQPPPPGKEQGCDGPC